VQKRIISAVKRVEFVSDRMSYIILRGRWCHIIDLNVHAQTEDKTDEVKDSFYEELERVFDTFPKYHMKILLGDFNAKVGREDILKPTIWNESLYEISKDNGVRVVNFATSKNLRVKSMMFPHRNIHKYTWTSPDGKTHNQIDHILVDTRRHSNILDVRSYRAADCDTHHYLVVTNLGSD
jgi:exonuclease III